MSLTYLQKSALLIERNSVYVRQSKDLHEEMDAVVDRVLSKVSRFDLRPGFSYEHSLRFLPIMYDSYLFSLAANFPHPMTAEELSLFYIEFYSKLPSLFEQKLCNIISRKTYYDAKCTGFLNDQNEPMCRFEIV